MYALVSGKTLYLFDGTKLVEQKTLNIAEVEKVAQYQLCESEEAFLQKYPDLQFCNYKRNSLKNAPEKIIAALADHLHPDDEVTGQLCTLGLKHAAHWDTYCVQAIKTMDELDRILNMLTKRLREWAEWVDPIQSKKFSDNAVYAKKLAAELSIHADLGNQATETDIQTMQSLAQSITQLHVQRQSLSQYVEQQLAQHAPEFCKLVGGQIGGKLLAQAKTFSHLARMTSSTLQVLGAEKALFRHLKTGAKPPKYGILYQHQLVAKAKDKGKAARQLANAINKAVKIDYYRK